MRTIKPGKLGTATEKTKEVTPNREIWDDMSPPAKAKKPSKKKAFERTDSGDMRQQKQEKLPVKKSEDRPEESIDEGPAYEARTDLDFLEKNLGCKLDNHELLERALTHRSALGGKERADYERLEFLGDAVLDLSVAHLLSDLFPDAREGELSKMRAALVNTQALAGIARELEVGPFVKLGRGEHSSGGAERPSILADVMEAIIGAIYREQGFDRTMKTIEGIYGDALSQVTPYDPKTDLQEALHVAGSEPPEYLLELVEGPEHAPSFVSVVMVDNDVAGRGSGPTKKASQQAAAAEALSKLKASAKKPELAEGQSELMLDSMLSSDKGIEPQKEEDK